MKDFSYYTFEAGRYTDNKYKPETKKLVWNVFNEKNGEIVPVNIFECNCRFLEKGLLEAKKRYSNDFIKFAEHIRGWLSHEYWSRCEYETIITSWPPYIEKEELDRLNKEEKTYRLPVDLITEYKMDIYTQVMLNWDRFIDYIWNNKKLITKRKLGLQK